MDKNDPSPVDHRRPIDQSAGRIANGTQPSEGDLGRRHDLDIVDIVSEPALAASKQRFAALTLIKDSPPPIRRFIGNMAQAEGILRTPGGILFRWR